MKQILILALTCLCVTFANASDLIIFKNGDEVEAIVEGITDTEITYRKVSYPDGPLIHVLKDNVFMIRYDNGTKEIISTVNSEGAVSAATSTSAPDYPYPTVTKTYQVGDIFNEDGLTGYVFYTTDNGRHGLMLATSKDATQGQFCKVNDCNFGADNADDGWANQKAVENYCDRNGHDFKSYYLPFYMANKHGEGWYVPSVNEAILIVKARNGGQLFPKNKDARKRFDKILKDYWKTGFGSMTDVMTSTEVSGKECYYVTSDKGEKLTCLKKDKLTLHGIMLSTANPIMRVFFVHKF